VNSLDDFRRHIDPRALVSLEQLSDCAARYDVSQMAATLRWIGFTQRRAVLVVSRDGYMLWARSSESALKSGAYFRTSSGAIPVPPTSMTAVGTMTQRASIGEPMAPGTWFPNQGCRECVIFSEQYDFALSLLQLEDEPRRRFGAQGDEDEQDEDLVERISRIHGLE
jgi:hypothetical protein